MDGQRFVFIPQFVYRVVVADTEEGEGMETEGESISFGAKGLLRTF